MIFLITTLIIAVVCGSTAYFCEKHNSSPKDYLDNLRKNLYANFP